MLPTQSPSSSLGYEIHCLDIVVVGVPVILILPKNVQKVQGDADNLHIPKRSCEVLPLSEKVSAVQ